MQLSEHNLALGSTTNSDYTPTVVSFLPQPMPHPTRRVGSTRAQHQSPPSVQVVAPVLAQSSLWPSHLTITSRRICSQIIRYYQTILSQIPHSGIQTLSTAWVKPHIGCCCSVLYPSFSQLSRTFFSFLLPAKKTESFSHRGIKKTHFTFFLSSGFSLLSAVLLLIAVSIYTALVRKCEAINTILLSMTDNSPKIPVGIVVGAGKALSLMWAACACMLLSVVPYFIRWVFWAVTRGSGRILIVSFHDSCCTWRG